MKTNRQSCFRSSLHSPRLRGEAGFTLIELLLVLVILAILAAVVVPKFTGRTQEAKITATKTQISSIKSALELFEHDNGRFPTSDEGLAALVNKPGDLPNWHSYMDAVPNDGWGNPFVYRFPGTNGKDYDIISYGPDGHEGGNDDLTN
ncbi:MAG: type II secretion system major pseudopilin GspG [Phycisphaerae bacterium]|nr:type II secretion system major pseudopilin GspG [Phycisphaerae bacterium]